MRRVEWRWDGVLAEEEGRGRGREDAWPVAREEGMGFGLLGTVRDCMRTGVEREGRVGCGGVAIVAWVSERGIGTDAGVWCVGKSGVGGGYLGKGVLGVRAVSVGMMGDAELVARGAGGGGFGEQGRITGKVVSLMGSQYFLYSSVWGGLLVLVVRPFPLHFLFLLSYVTREGEVKAGVCAIGPWCWDFFVREV